LSLGELVATNSRLVLRLASPRRGRVVIPFLAVAWPLSRARVGVTTNVRPADATLVVGLD